MSLVERRKRFYEDAIPRFANEEDNLIDGGGSASHHEIEAGCPSNMKFPNARW